MTTEAVSFKGKLLLFEEVFRASVDEKTDSQDVNTTQFLVLVYHFFLRLKLLLFPTKNRKRLQLKSEVDATKIASACDFSCLCYDIFAKF